MSHRKMLFLFLCILALTLVASGALGAGLARVTGSGIVYLPDGGVRVATVSARMMPDGTVEGELEGVLLTDGRVLIHADVDCMRFFEMEGTPGKGAVLSGWSTFEKDFPPYVPTPTYIVVAVFDAGEGSNSGDIFSRGYPALDPEALSCQDPFPWPLIPLDDGNVQVYYD